MRKGGMIAKWVALGLLGITAFGFVTMTLWNWLVPTLFNGPIITFWQTLGLLVLSKILFSGMGGRHHGHHTGGGYGTQWKKRFFDKVSSMSPEEREVFKQKMKDKWCRWDETNSDKNSGDSNV
jgi:hypothetical protein